MLGNVLLTWIAFLIAGPLSGAVIAYAMDFRSRRELLQGALAGLIVGILYMVT